MNLAREPPGDRVPHPVTMKEMDLVQRVSFGNLSRCFRKIKQVDRVHRRRISPIPEDVKLVWRTLWVLPRDRPLEFWAEQVQLRLPEPHPQLIGRLVGDLLDKS